MTLYFHRKNICQFKTMCVKCDKPLYINPKLSFQVYIYQVNSFQKWDRSPIFELSEIRNMHTFFNENSQFEKYLFLCVQDIPLKLKPGAGILVIKSQRGPKYRKPLEKNRSISMGFLGGSNHDMSLLSILKWTSFIFSSIKQCKQIFFKTE